MVNGYYALVGAAAERKIGIAEVLDEGSVDKDVKIREYHAQAFVCKNVLIFEAGVAPDCLVGFFLDAAGQLGEGLNLIERVASGEGDVCEFVVLDDVKELLDRHFPAAFEVPGLGVMAAGTMMRAAGAVDGGAQAGTVGHCFVCYV